MVSKPLWQMQQVFVIAQNQFGINQLSCFHQNTLFEPINPEVRQ
jgi:hypothetical protein